jgi:hypothetical protein
MEQLITVLFWAVATFVAVRVLTALFDAWLFSRVEKKLDRIELEIEQGNLIPLAVEVDGGQYLCYNSLTKEFVCQGTCLVEIQQRFKSRFPGKNAAIHGGNETAVKTLESQLKEQNENLGGVRPAS